VTGTGASGAQAFEDLDDHHASAAFGTDRGAPLRLRRAAAGPIKRGDLVGGDAQGEKLAAALEVGLALTVGEQAVVADAVEPVRQNVEKEAADELVGRQGHHLFAGSALAAVILPAVMAPTTVPRLEAVLQQSGGSRLASSNPTIEFDPLPGIWRH
jgi:hypothetical protein